MSLCFAFVTLHLNPDIFIFSAEPPRILTPANKLYQVIADSPALIDCAYFGSPKPEIEW